MRASKEQKGRDKREGEGGGVDEVDDTADAGEEVAAVLHANTPLNERTGEIPRHGQDKNTGEKPDGIHRGKGIHCGEFRLNIPEARHSAEDGENEGADDPLPRFLGRDGGAEGTRDKTAPNENSAEVGPDIAEFGEDNKDHKDGQAELRIHVPESEGKEPARIDKGEDSGADAAERTGLTAFQDFSISVFPGRTFRRFQRNTEILKS